LRALVTGCNGYIGKILTKYIKENFSDSFILGVDNEPEHKPNTFTDLQIFRDITNEKIPEYVLGYQIDTIFHLAAAASVPESILRPYHFYDNNVGQTAKLLANLEQIDWQGNFIFSSSAGVYAKNHISVSEISTIAPPHPYGESKMMCEKIMQLSTRYQNKIKFVAFRFFNVAGPSGNCGDHLNSGHVLQKICHAAITGNTFTINGDNLPTPDGTCVRDYVHVLDVVRAHITAAQNMNTQYERFSAYNLGSSVGISVKQLVEAFKDITKEPLNVEYGPVRKGDPAHLVADPKKFMEDYNFVYLHSSLNEIICSAWKYYKFKYEMERLNAV